MGTPPKLPETLEEAHALILKLLLRIDEQDRRIEEQDRRIAELERQLNMNSQNSSKPPSSDLPSLKLPPKKKPSGRKPGGQPGHKGSHRELLPLEQVDEVIDHWPTHCENCQAPMDSVLVDNRLFSAGYGAAGKVFVFVLPTP